MYWEKPNNLRYVDMCKWIDENAHKEDCNQEQLFNYLYGLSLILAYKWSYFDNQSDYDDFCIYFSSSVFKRLLNKDKPKINYILPYIKKSIGLFRIRFKKQQKKSQQENISFNSTVSVSGGRLSDMITGGVNKCNFDIYLGEIHRAIYQTVRYIPRERDSFEFQNIYISCLLTFLNRITFTDDDMKLLCDLQSHTTYLSALRRLFGNYRAEKPILYHLDDTYSDYVELLVNKASSFIRDELIELLEENLPTMGIIDLIEEEQNDNGQLEET